MRILIRPRLPVLVLLLLAPTIPELLTGSTPISELVSNPPGFAVGFGLDIALYGCGALLIREFAVVFRKGWGSILLLGGAYGIAEEGFEVHTFFQPSGSPVNALATYGHAWGVNWLWALGLTCFHAAYSIALPILLTRLWFPRAAGARWLDRGSLALVGGVYALEVVGFGFLVPNRPGLPPALLFLLFAAALVYLAYRLPKDLLAPRAGPARLGPAALALSGALLWVGWIAVLILAAAGTVPAFGAGAVFLAFALGGFAGAHWGIGAQDSDRSWFYFATGMLIALAIWDVPVEFSVPGILGVTAVVLYSQYRLGRRLAGAPTVPAPPGAPMSGGGS